jgi:hypothetical protein
MAGKSEHNGTGFVSYIHVPYTCILNLFYTLISPYYTDVTYRYDYEGGYVTQYLILHHVYVGYLEPTFRELALLPCDKSPEAK